MTSRMGKPWVSILVLGLVAAAAAVLVDCGLGRTGGADVGRTSSGSAPRTGPALDAARGPLETRARELADVDAAADDTLAISGEVVFADGLLSHEEPIVVAVGFARSEVAGVRSRLPRELWRELGRSPISKEGRFGLRVPSDVLGGELTLRAEHLFVPEPIALARDRVPPRAVLVARRGCSIRFELTPADDGEHAPGLLVGRRIAIHRTANPFTHAGPMDYVVGAISKDLSVELRGAPPGEEHRLESATLDGVAPFARFYSDWVSGSPGESVVVRVPVVGGLVVEGRVVDEAGQPIEEAALSASWTEVHESGSGTYYEHASSDSDGRFEFEALHPKVERIETAREGFWKSVWRRDRSDPTPDFGGFEVVLRRKR